MKSVQDGVREGEVTYHGLWTPALSFGICLNIGGLNDDGSTGTTGWEAAYLPVVGFEVEFSQGADDYVTTILASSRRAHYSSEMFMRPERSMQAFGLASGSDAVQIGGTVGSQHAYGDASAANTATASSAMPSAQLINASMADAGFGASTDHTGNMTRKEGTATGQGLGDNIVGNNAAANAGAGTVRGMDSIRTLNEVLGGGEAGSEAASRPQGGGGGGQNDQVNADRGGGE